MKKYYLKLTTSLVILFFSSLLTSAQEVDYSKYGVDEEVHLPDGLKIGDIAPSIKGYDQNGKFISSDELLSDKNLVIIFYRGVWCPVCVRYLKNLQDSLQYIEDAGAVVLAITPEVQDKVDKTVSKTNAEFLIVSDSTEQIMREYDVWFDVTSYYETKVNAGRLGDIASNNGKETARLPVPATFVLDSEGRIIYRHFEINYKSRASVADILSALNKK